MRKLIVFSLFMLLLLTSCVTNTNYVNNKRVLDGYAKNPHYTFITSTTYESTNKIIDFKQLINNKIMKDGRSVELIYSTRYQQTLIGNNLYFCYEYKRNADIGHHALGYVDCENLEVYLDYFDYQRYSFDYNFSTSKFVCFTFKKDLEVIDIVFFKDLQKLEFDYDLNRLEYSEAELEEKHVKDYYFEDGIKYELSYYNQKLINTLDGSVIDLPYENDLLDRVPLLKEMYEKFTCENIRINASYISTGEELFFYIHDRPTNNLNVPFMVFKCNSTLTEVEYIGYSEKTIKDVVYQ